MKSNLEIVATIPNAVKVLKARRDGTLYVPKHTPKRKQSVLPWTKKEAYSLLTKED